MTKQILSVSAGWLRLTLQEPATSDCFGLRTADYRGADQSGGGVELIGNRTALRMPDKFGIFAVYAGLLDLSRPFSPPVVSPAV